ncbi:alpha/beta fold hydrolase [Rhodococcus sp. ABRD24]|uniref:alpha/beta hydrolase n=1 Tax=Rhodococcus sp. ABRD24 TaxID=2507582 RepID=UPI00103961F2|nr:alpha/beta fold hydrolase [Rhodococcus sp. ABRD24]QBJ94634.1 alpha/beta fold hydrolase [Rhodococcus sp. ABRD24]
MDAVAYAGFLPDGYRSAYREPESTWWQWRGRRVHIARAVRPDARVRVMGIHGAGGHAMALWSFAALAADEGVEILFPDMPIYGLTVEPRPAQVRYHDWIDLLCDLVDAERACDPRPLVLFGASMGGMMAYEVASRTGQVAAVLATCLLDPADPRARAAAARWGAAGKAAPALLPPIARVAGGLRPPIKWLVRMNRMSNDPDLSRLCASDPRGGGVRVPLGFLADWFTFPHAVPEQFTAAPVTLVHPAADRWTPPQLSQQFLDRICAPTQSVLLENCGHWPIEEPGLAQLITTARSVIAGVAEQG